MAYSKQTWIDDDESSPISAQRLQHLEDGVEAAHNIATNVTRTSLSVNNVDNTADIDKPISTQQQAAISGKSPKLSVSAVATTSGAALVNAHNPIDATSGNLTTTLPTGMPGGSTIVIEKTDSSTNTVTCSGSIRGSASTLVLALARESIEFLADSAGSWWPIAGHKTLSSIDARIAVGDTAARTYADSLTWNVRTVTIASTAALYDYIIADTTGGTFAVAAPTPTINKQFAVKWKAGAAAPTLTGSFNGAPVISVLDQAIEFVSDGTNWYRTVRPALAQIPDYPAVTDTRYLSSPTITTPTLTSPIINLAKRTITSNTSLVATDAVVFCNGTLTATLPSAASSLSTIRIANIHASANATVASAGGTINGATTFTLEPGSSAIFESTGTNWVVF